MTLLEEELLDQSFSGGNLKKLYGYRDSYKFSLGSSKQQRIERFAEIGAAVNDPAYEFSALRKGKVNGSEVFSLATAEDEYVIRKVNDNLTRVYEVRHPDRNKILPQIRNLLADESEYWVVKIDLKKFFEKVDRENLLRDIELNLDVSSQTKRFIRMLFKDSHLNNYKGLPRGISISSTLAEIYMRTFDVFCRSLVGCYYYVRYVDDILLFAYEDPFHLIEKIKNALPKGAEINEAKFLICHHPSVGRVSYAGSQNCITYLGYEFDFDFKGNNKVSVLKVGLSLKKIKRIKTRVMLSLFDFCRNQNFDLLKNRMNFIAGNYKIHENNSSGNLYSGIYYGNRLINEYGTGQLSDLDAFRVRAIYSRGGSLGRALSGKLTSIQRDELAKISLSKGFELKRVRKFSLREFKEIKGIWLHD